MDIRGKAGHEVHKLLINEDSVRLIVNALVLQPASPPAQHKVRFGPRTHSKKAQIVRAGLHDSNIVGKCASLRRLANMRREHKGGATVQRRHYAVERAKDLDVRVKI